MGDYRVRRWPVLPDLAAGRSDEHRQCPLREEQYADTDGFTDHLFGISAMLGYRLVLRIRDLPSKRLDPAATPTELRQLVGGKALIAN